MPIESTIELLLSEGVSCIDRTTKKFVSSKPEFLCYPALLFYDSLRIAYNSINDARKIIQDKISRFY